MIVTVTSSGANVSGYPNNNITPVTITTVGTDPTDPTRTIYRVTFTNQMWQAVFLAVAILSGLVQCGESGVYRSIQPCLKWCFGLQLLQPGHLPA
jgi:hypothetical protein